MKRRSTDKRDQITDGEIKSVRIPWWKTFKLFLMNLPAIYKFVALAIALVTGTIAAPQVLEQVSHIAGGEDTIPDGMTTTPNPDAPIVAWRGDVNTALMSQKTAVDLNTSGIEALRAEITELEKRLASQRARGDNKLEQRVINLESVVQP